ncbi:MAG: translation elongation factor Ts [Deltaproteobacteria bacterium]|nr:translation elongation factor Ts [Deltaproteobacteria bacterium]
MSSVPISAIRELRERTQAGMADCKSALVEAEGDLEKAVEVILKKGKAKSAKRAGKIAAEGEVRTEVFEDGRAAVIAEVNIETDFSARNENFTAFVDKVMAVAKTAEPGADLAALETDGKTIADHASELTAVVGEKVTVRRFDRLALADGKHGFCHSYVHMGGKIGVILAIEAETAEAGGHEAVKTFADETAMQVAAMNPMTLKREQLDEALVAKQREIFEAQLRDDPKPKPEKVWPKIIEGKVNKWFAEVVLLEQQSAQHKKPIDELRKEAGEAAGAPIVITGFVRFERGEGIEKKQDDVRVGVAELLQK